MLRPPRPSTTSWLAFRRMPLWRCYPSCLFVSCHQSARMLHAYIVSVDSVLAQPVSTHEDDLSVWFREILSIASTLRRVPFLERTHFGSLSL